MNSRKKPAILIVDDEKEIQFIIKMILIDKGYEISFASNVDEALLILEKKTFNLLLTDYLMAEKTGLDLIHKTKKSHPDMVTILITGSGIRDLFSEAINKGDIFSLVEKPFKSDYLQETVKRALDFHFHKLDEKK